MSAKLRKEKFNNAARLRGSFCPKAINLSEDAKDSGLSSTALTTLNMAVFAPMPNASIKTAIKVNPGCFSNIRAPKRRSCHQVSSEANPHIVRISSFAKATLPNARRAAYRASSGASPASMVSDPALDPFPCLSLHFKVVLMRSVIEATPLTLRRARFGVTTSDLVESGLHSVEREEAILRAVDDQDRARGDQCRQVGQIEVAIQPVDVERKADAVDDVLFDLRAERSHPSHGHRRLDPLIERGEQETAPAADRQPNTAEPPLVHFRARSQIIKRADVVPDDNPGPCDARREEAARDQLFVLRRALIECPDLLLGHRTRAFAVNGRVVVE